MKNLIFIVVFVSTIFLLVYWAFLIGQKEHKRIKKLKEETKNQCVGFKIIYKLSLEGTNKTEALEKGRMFYRNCKQLENVEEYESIIQNDLSVMNFKKD